MATDHMYGLDAVRLLNWMLEDLKHGSALGIVKELFFIPGQDDPFRMERYGVTLETPIGVAAGPHSQMAQNIIAAWLCGARYMELKTIQELDQIVVTKPCIDMRDEGYNCEWSQELRLEQSYEEYLKAWVLLHILHDHLGFAGKPGMIFNMSAGYSMEGILTPGVQRFLDRMQNCAADVEAMKKRLAEVYPRAAEIAIPGVISDNLTISCMHGCPPDEVERISLYFLRERKFHTTLKMNPTLLGSDRVRGILNDTLGYDMEVPDIAFEHDLPYEKALSILANCRRAADEVGVRFSVKLTNTLETTNSGKALPDKEKMVYMSGRALHPVSLSLARRLQNDCGGDLDISFCAGVDAVNLADTLSCGLAPVTVCSDLLKPGGYGRLAQYMENIRTAMAALDAESLKDFACKTAGTPDYKSAVLKNLADNAARATDKSSRYAKAAVKHTNVKTARPLPALDCASAPCMSGCPAGQHIPAYLERAAAGDMEGSLAVILATNPFPAALGTMCNQPCREKCMRVQYDEALHIRDVKGCAAKEGKRAPRPAPANGRSVAVIGAGPAGLSCAWFLALAGCYVAVYEASARPGGRMLGPVLDKNSKAAKQVRQDVEAILSLGVRLHCDHTIDADKLAGLGASCDAVYLATEAEQLSSVSLSNIFRPSGAGASGAMPSLPARVGEGRRASAAILSRLGLLLPEGSGNGRGGMDIADLRRKQGYRLACVAKKQADETAALAGEASRCLQCDRFCGICVSVCPNRANVLLDSQARSWPVQQAEMCGDGVRITTLATGGLEQTVQIMNIGDFCNECGNCAAFCPSAGAPYKDKRRLHLTLASFDADSNGCLRDGDTSYRGKTSGRAWSLRKESGILIYEDEDMKAELDENSLQARVVALKQGRTVASLLPAVEAAVFCSLVSGNPALASILGAQPEGAA